MRDEKFILVKVIVERYFIDLGIANPFLNYMFLLYWLSFVFFEMSQEILYKRRRIIIQNFGTIFAILTIFSERLVCRSKTILKIKIVVFIYVMEQNVVIFPIAFSFKFFVAEKTRFFLHQIYLEKKFG